MKTIGLLGGMSWESTAEYYRIINQTVRSREGGVNSARIVMYSVEFAQIGRMQNAGQWDDLADLLSDAARGIEGAGADFLLICTNTMHKVADAIQLRIGIPILHIADPTAAAIHTRGLKTVALLGTRFTMEEDFYLTRLEREHGIHGLVPDADDREIINRVIYEELCAGRIEEASKAEYLRIVQNLAERGAQGVILGCTEIGLLIKPDDLDLPVFDTARIHAIAAVEAALKG
ncbi:MAG: aspartate/glutamate racemase family protein [Alphaproteobacteria bacterium]|nr:aspartate/glutamate racemase family protein [Alphaproteobacteria bacterium]